MGTSYKKPNRYRTLCHICNHYCNAGDGYLDGQSPITGQWKVRCADQYKCAKQAGKKQSRKSAAAQDADVLANLL